MKHDVTAAAVQFNISLGEIDHNLATASEGLRRVAAQGAQLAVLPEMWSTGYDYRHLSDLAEQTPRVLITLQSLSLELKLVIVGSLPEKDGNALYNTLYVIDQGKQVGHYRKLHLFSSMGEDRFLAAGHNSLVVPTSAGRLGLAICYDLRFPELFRKLALEGAEILCIPAEWPKPRQEHWRTLLRARAIENQMFVVATNCCGIQGKLDFFGMSMLISARGDILQEAGEKNTELIATFSHEEMVKYRSQIPCFKDRRPEVYGTLP
ncbi:carbon-nitrogen family hydrolase [Desulfuromonas acetoxidans]|uniref:carbon-nitrogen family hydrolase n=1 Tax=Desulfuromonas acetoxidans TaxID=891 RepID=UPI001592DFCF|nr:carbon-nitrogen family hydrolase [Desulfuromonas acetoxidans]MBF0646830.1 carbon-nitrogen family hydrolase [Desulfuromonas acetoxidans]NVD24932.1 carbon-nitrogen family hydrolase [Desulfuromonas acetoxidans]NVE15233.1 carbon-nitrogen family hydrolase [Desulfuromonas acetoxidans]